MDLRNKVYQMFMIAPQGTQLEVDKNLYNALKSGLGGAIFFTKNIISIEQTQTFTKQILKTALIKPFIGIDQEGGRVERTENIFNGKKFLSAKYQAKKGIEIVQEQSLEIAKLLNTMGFNMNFAPVLDVDTNPKNPIIAERAYGSTPKDVEKFAICAMNTYIKNNIIPVGKHFPGHGDVNADSHLTLPTLELPLEKVEKIHISPFKTAIKQNIPAIMVAHLFCPCFDDEKIPSSLSPNVLNYLRNTLQFDGLIISDDMQMGGVSAYDSTDAVTKGIFAGINLFLFRESTDAIISIIESIVRNAETNKELAFKIEESFNIIQKIKTKFL